MEESFPDEQDEERPRGGRVIVHLDLDCFYAQVEMLRNPELRSKPLGIQQKSIITTCNYEARKFGIRKLMPVKESIQKCPELILVNGEDLTPYREMSYKVTEFLGEFCPLVERLGLDENFLDITELVGKRFRELERNGNSQIPICGHVYNQQAVNLQDPTHIRLILGSQLTQEFREALRSRLGLTGCAGIASNKFLAKLVSGIFRPDQQTLLLPENHQDLLSSLDHVQKIPGIGSKTTQRLEALGVRKIPELQDFPAFLLEKELGVSAARRIRKFAFGDDNSPVIPWGPPQSFTEEDSFPECSSEAEATEKIRELLPKLLARIAKDGRQPHTVRLGIRRLSSPGNFSKRECRQCPIPPQLVPRFGKAIPDLIPPLLRILLQLFRKLIDVSLPFHLTLLSVGFFNFREFPGNNRSIASYLTRVSGWKSGNSKQFQPDPSGLLLSEQEGEGSAGSAAPELQKNAGTAVFPWNSSDADSKREANSQEKEGFVLPPNVDPKVFSELPMDVREELVAQWKSREAGKSVEKSPEKGKSRKGRRNLGALSQSKDLLWYWKGRGGFSGWEKSG